MFLGGNQSMSVGGSEVFTLNKDELATLAGGLGDGYYGTKEFWREVLVTYQAVTEKVITNTSLVNPGFDTDLSGWSNLARASWSAGKLLIDATAGSGGRQAEQAFTTEIGKTYTVSVDAENLVSAGSVNVAYAAVYQGSNYGGANLGNGFLPGIGTGVVSFSFVATGTTSYLVFSLADNGDAATFDNVVIEQISENPASPTSQRKTLRFTDGNIKTISFSSTAPTGVYEIRSVVIVDKDHGHFVISKADIPNQSFYNIVVS